MKHIFLLFLGIMTLSMVAGLAVLPDEILGNPVLEFRARALSAGLRCLVCQNETIDESLAPLARDLRLLIRERLLSGDSDSEIISFLTARYGEFILLHPPFNLKTAPLWFFPPILLSLIFGVIFFRLRRCRKGCGVSIDERIHQIGR